MRSVTSAAGAIGPRESTTTPGPTGSGPPTTASPYYDDYELASTYFNDGNNYVCDAEGNAFRPCQWANRYRLVMSSWMWSWRNRLPQGR